MLILSVWDHLDVKVGGTRILNESLNLLGKILPEFLQILLKVWFCPKSFVGRGNRAPGPLSYACDAHVEQWEPFTSRAGSNPALEELLLLLEKSSYTANKYLYSIN